MHTNTVEDAAAWERDHSPEPEPVRPEDVLSYDELIEHYREKGYGRRRYR